MLTCTFFDRLSGFTAQGFATPLPYGRGAPGLGRIRRFLPPLAPETAFPAETALEYLDWAGVDKAVLLQGPWYGDMNQYVAAAVRRWPDRFIGAALIDPWLPSGSQSLTWLIEDLGFPNRQARTHRGRGIVRHRS